MMLLLGLLVVIAVTVDGQLDFGSSQTGREVDIRCTVTDLQSTQITSIISLVILRFDGGADHVLASIAVGASQPVIHDLEGAIVTSSLTQDGLTENFLNIHWPMVNQTLDGNYTCRLNGLDQDFLPVSINAHLALMLEATDPALLVTPLVIEEGLTRSLKVRCSMLDPANLDVSEVLLIELFHKYLGIDQLIASVSAFSGVEAQPGSGWTEVTGYVATIDQENFLEASWPYPTPTEMGTYRCDINALENGTSHPLYFTRTVNVTSSDPTKQQLIDRIHDLEMLYHTASLEIQDLIHELQKMNDTLYYMQDYYVFACTFERDLCGLVQDTTERLDWTRNKGSTSSANTGPTADHTLGTTEGYYLYLEASAPAVSNDIARVESEPILSPTRSVCVNFHYHMYGQGMGTLNIRLRENNVLGAPLWTRSGNQGLMWKEASIVLPMRSTPFSVVFEAVRGSDITGDISIDDVVISDINCATGNDAKFPDF